MPHDESRPPDAPDPDPELTVVAILRAALVDDQAGLDALTYDVDPADLLNVTLRMAVRLGIRTAGSVEAFDAWLAGAQREGLLVLAEGDT